MEEIRNNVIPSYNLPWTQNWQLNGSYGDFSINCSWSSPLFFSPPGAPGSRPAHLVFVLRWKVTEEPSVSLCSMHECYTKYFHLVFHLSSLWSLMSSEHQITWFIVSQQAGLCVPVKSTRNVHYWHLWGSLSWLLENANLCGHSKNAFVLGDIPDTELWKIDCFLNK